MKHLPGLSLLALLLVGLPIVAQAPLSEKSQEPDLSELLELLNTPISIGTTKAVTVFTSPSTVTVLDREMLDRYGFQSLVEAVETVSGMYISRTIFHRSLATSRGVLQESYANRVLLLVNGVSTWNTMTGDMFLERVDIMDVERIEVLKGPASVLYGTNAYAGAINVILRKEKETRTRINGGQWDQGGHRGGLQHTQIWDGVTLFASVAGSHEKTESLLVKAETGPDFVMRDYNKMVNANLRLEAGHHTLLANVFRQNSAFFGSAVTYAAGGGKDWDESGHFINYTYQNDFTKTWNLKYSFTLDASARVPYISQDGSAVLRQRGSRNTHVLSTSWEASRQFRLEGGLTTEYRKNNNYDRWNDLAGTFTDDSGMKNKSVHESSAYLQGNWDGAKWKAVLGSRYTNNTVFGGNTSSRLTVVRVLDEQQSLKLIVGQSFRAPDLLAQYFLFRTALGNKDLKPETSNSIEFAYLVSRGSVFIQTQAYYTTYKDKIIRIPLYPTMSSNPADANKTIYYNGPGFKSWGVDFEAKYQNPRVLNAFLNLDWMAGNKGDAFPGMKGYNYKFVPAWSGTAGISKDLSGWTLSVLANHQAATEGPLAPIPSWTSLDASVAFTHKVGKAQIRHTAAVKDALDQERYFPEFTRRIVNVLPEGNGRRAIYTVGVSF